MTNETMVLGTKSGLQSIVGLQALRSQARGHDVFGLREPQAGAAVQGFQVRAADCPQFKRVASALVSRRYTQRGYLTNSRASEGERHLLTLSAVADGQRTLGTLGIRFDSDAGLGADAIFADEMEALRIRGLDLCEFTQLALDVDVPSKTVLAALFHTAYIHAHHVHASQMLVIEVNPRHVAYYRRMLGFKVCSEARLNTRVQAPAVLMSLDFGYVEQQLRRYGGQPALGSLVRTLYPFFFSPQREAEIIAELRQAALAA